MGVNSDDGFRVMLVNTNDFMTPVAVLGEFSGGRGVTDTTFDFFVVEDGLYPLRFTFEEGTGDAAVEWWIQDLTTGNYVGVNGSDLIRAFRVPDSTPELTIAATGGNIRISWPSTAVGYGLQISPTLAPSAWTFATPIVTLAGERSFTTAPAGEARFFRLVRQQVD
jgi:hypothetical protein